MRRESEQTEQGAEEEEEGIFEGLHVCVGEEVGGVRRDCQGWRKWGQGEAVEEAEGLA